MRHFKIQLRDRAGAAIQTAGGKAYVTAAGGTAKLALLDSSGAAASNPSALTNGTIEFWCADTVASVDLYIQAPSGHFVVTKALAASGPNSITVDKSLVATTMIIPFNIADTAAATETDTGFDLPTNAIVVPHGLAVDVSALHAAKTIDVGILSTEANGDANGLIAAVSLAAVATVVPAVTVTAGVFASITTGALVSEFTAGTNSDDRGLFCNKSYVCDGVAHSISYTLSSGSTTPAGFMKIPLQLPQASL